MTRATAAATLLAIVLLHSSCVASFRQASLRSIATCTGTPDRSSRHQWGQSIPGPAVIEQGYAGGRCRLYQVLSSSKPRDGFREDPRPLRQRLRALTGFSLTAIRTTIRTATGLSATAIYATTLAATGAWIRQAMKVLLDVFPTWFRYFVQPFLVLYYVPLFMLRNIAGPTRSNAKHKHELIMESWKDAVETADKVRADWPLHVHNGVFETDDDGVDVNEVVAEAVQIAFAAQENDVKK
jgi:hypothetical protein